MNNGHELIEALNQIEKEKGISKDILLEIGRASCRERVF